MKINYLQLDQVKYLRMLIDSKAIPRVNLTEVYRQQDGSSIIDLAHRMKHGEPIDITKRFHDRSFISCNVASNS